MQFRKKFIINASHFFKHIIFVQAGFYLLLDENGDKGSRYMFDKLSLSDKVHGLDIDSEHVDIVTEYLKQLSSIVPVTWFGSRIEPHFTDKQILNKTCEFDFNLRAGQRSIFIKLDEYIKERLSTIKNIKFLSQNKTLDYQFPRDFMTCNHIIWSDVDHLSSYGEELMGKRLPNDFLVY